MASLVHGWGTGLTGGFIEDIRAQYLKRNNKITRKDVRDIIRIRHEIAEQAERDRQLYTEIVEAAMREIGPAPPSA
jgi:translation initiation factor 2 beta subunit (eIF-2beta)/eIF-5